MLILNGKPVRLDKFPDGTLLIKECVEDGKTQIIDWRFQSNEEFVALSFLTNHIRDTGDYYIILRMWYIPNARQDRVKNPDDVFTLKHFAKMINSLAFNEVQVFDPHSSVSEALFNNISVYKSEHLINDIYKQVSKIGDTVVFYPDEGAMKRYSKNVKKPSGTRVPYAFGIKDRDWSSGEIKGLLVVGEDIVKGKNVLIVDDICSRGGTFYHSAKKLKEIGAEKIFLYVSHCENTILDGEVLKSGLIEKVYTTNSILTARHEKIEVIEI